MFGLIGGSRSSWSLYFSRIALVIASLGALGLCTCEPLALEGNDVYGLSSYGGYVYYDLAVSGYGSTAIDQIKRVPTSGGSASVLATINVWGDLVQADSTGVYYSAYVGDNDRAALYTVPLAGGTPRRMWIGAAYDEVIDLVLSPTKVYFIHHDDVTDLSIVKQLSKAAGSVPTTMVGPNIDYFEELAISGSWLYFSSCEGNFIRRVHRTYLTVQTLVSGSAGINCPNGIATDGVYVYFTSGSKVYRVLASGGPITLMYGGDYLPGIAPYSFDAFVDQNYYYWIMALRQASYPFRLTDTWLRKISKNGGTPTLMLNNAKSEFWAMDSSALYTGTSAGVFKIQK